ncbi:hypothetical protein [Aquimonas sp.]|uniref:hypothetical protein n=1 Tax=Aquimonas sp. TaxID=1872588 RepID=UPI0037C18520
MKPSIVRILLASLLLAFQAQAQMLSQRMSVHPENIAPEADFLVLVEDNWPDGCGGEVRVTAQASVIDIVAEAARPPLGTACTQALAPFQRLIEPRAELARGSQFAASVKINYWYDIGSGPTLVESVVVVFNDKGNSPKQVDTGTWSTPSLGNSGLFIDQQSGLLTAALFDYGRDGNATWHYTGGWVNGNTFVGPISRYSTVVCVTAPCPRALPMAVGRVRMLLDARSRMLVEFVDVLPPAAAGGGLEYRRLDFERSDSLANASLDIPDLTGHWMGGVASAAAADSSPIPGEVKEWWIAYGGRDDEGGITREFFHAYAEPLGPADGRPPATPLVFRIECADLRVVDGPVECGIHDYPHSVGACVVSFGFDSAGQAQLSAKAECNGSRSFAAGFHLFRVSASPRTR